MHQTHEQHIITIGLTQTTDFLPFVGHFLPRWAKNDLQRVRNPWFA
jgi:hypothetical protein